MNNYGYNEKRFHTHLVSLRKCAGLTAEAMGNKLGISKQAYLYIENHIDKPMNKMQYISIRSIIEEEVYKNPLNINLIDCYDLIFSSPDFYEENIDVINYAIHHAVEDTKLRKKEDKKLASKNKGDNTVSVGFMTGASIITLGVGGIAATTFPFVYAGIAGVAFAAGVCQILRKPTGKKKCTAPDNRESKNIVHADWRVEVFNSYIQDGENAEKD